MEYLSGRTKESEDFCRNLHRRTTSSIRKKVSMRRTDDQGNAKSRESSLHLDEGEFDQERRFSLPKKQPGGRTKLPVDQEDDSGRAKQT